MLGAGCVKCHDGHGHGVVVLFHSTCVLRARFWSSSQEFQNLLLFRDSHSSKRVLFRYSHLIVFLFKNHHWFFEFFPFIATDGHPHFLRTPPAMTTTSAFNVAKALWRNVLDEWTVKCVQWRILYVHRSTNKVLPAFVGIPTTTSNPTTPESVLQFHMEKKRKAFHLGFIAYHTPECALTEEAAKEFISMTAYLRDTHQMFVQPCGEKNFFFHGGIKFIDDHYVEFKALDDYKEPEQPGINLLTATINLVRSRAAMGYYSKDTQTY